MTSSEIRSKILTDDNFVKSEIEKLLLYFNLKHTIRYNHQREETARHVESVAEHVYGMHVLCNYFLPLYEAKEMNRDFIYHLITWHDMAEAVVGDMASELKTEEHKNAEIVAEKNLLKTITPHLTDIVTRVFDEYHSQNTWEAQFVRAIDKLEPLFHLVLLARKNNSAPFTMSSTIVEDEAYRGKSIKKFDLLQRFDDVITTELYTYDYFKKE